MPRRSKGPRLYLDSKRGQWVVRDGPRFIRTRAGASDRDVAEKFLAEYIGNKYRPTPSPTPLIADVLSVYASEVAPHKKTARNIAYNISNLLKWWGTKTVAEISVKSCREYAATKLSQGAAADLKILKLAVAYWHQEYGPLQFQPSFWRPKGNPPKDRWLTRLEAAQLLRAARPYPYLRRFILLGLYTGSRPGVILALKWGQVDLAAGILSRLPRGAAQDAKKRSPKVRLGRRILAHLERWRRLDGAIKYICHLDGQPVVDPHTSWRKVVAAAGLQGVTRHTLRHTRATWMMQAKVPIWEAAGFLGMSTKTLERVYAHHDPGWQEQAANI
jgi:integrase